MADSEEDEQARCGLPPPGVSGRGSKSLLQRDTGGFLVTSGIDAAAGIDGHGPAVPAEKLEGAGLVIGLGSGLHEGDLALVALHEDVVADEDRAAAGAEAALAPLLLAG